MHLGRSEAYRSTEPKVARSNRAGCNGRKSYKTNTLWRLLIFNFGYCSCRITAITAVIYEKGATMPKLKNSPPEYQKSGKYAVVYHNGKRCYLGLYSSKESHVAYSRFLAERQANPTFHLEKGETDIAICELTAAFLDHTKVTSDSKDYSHCRVVVLEFMDKLYGDDIPVDNFKPGSLKLVREEMIRSRRFCRRTVNRYTHRIVSIFAWGVENELVKETTWRALKSVKSLPEGNPGTFDNEEREPVPDDVIRRTLPFMPPTLRAMVVVQRLTGCRPGEIFKIRVGDIDRTQ